MQASVSATALPSRLILMLALLSDARMAAAGADLLLGVLEDEPGAAAGAAARPRVRVAFRHSAAAGWEAFPNDCSTPDCLRTIAAGYPAHTQWAISLAGLNLGTILGRTPPAYDAYSLIGTQDVVGHGSVPFVGKRSIQYAGFMDEPVHRPLLATSGRRMPRRSQAGWKEDAPEPEDLDRVWPTFRRLIPRIDDCEPETQARTAGSAATPGGRAPAKLELEIPAAWIARNRDAILKVIVREEVFKECDGPRAYPSQLWLYRQASGRVWPLPGQLQPDQPDLIAPLDFDDLLRDGRDEILFLAAGHNRGGYVLYYDGLRSSVKFTWTYH